MQKVVHIMRKYVSRWGGKAMNCADLQQVSEATEEVRRNSNGDRIRSMPLPSLRTASLSERILSLFSPHLPRAEHPAEEETR